MPPFDASDCESARRDAGFFALEDRTFSYIDNDCYSDNQPDQKQYVIV